MLRSRVRSVLCGALGLLALVAFTPTSHADPYGVAGCGFGAVLFDDSPSKFKQVLAATSNGLLGNQTFAITSGTSRCGEPAEEIAGAKAFVEANRQALAHDIARGDGETIANLSSLAGCQDSKAVGATLQGSFPDIFPRPDVADTEVSDRVVETLQSHPELACANLS
ncbi:MAG: DUF3015 family protein [Myxococcota bacterium]